MKVILSRKGFDSGTGGYASPILPDGTLLSLPIPDSSTTIRYSDLNYDGNSYHTLMRSLKGDSLKQDGKKSVLSPNSTCHLDPDLMRDVIPRDKHWRGLFGQIDRAQSHLVNQGIEEGDLFLFFGWFKKTIIENGRLQFDSKDRFGRHIIYGYLQIDDIVQADNEKKLEEWMKYHPHALKSRLSRYNNTLYIAKEKLTFIKGLPGFGVFKYANHRVLTKFGERNRSYWQLPEEFKSLAISCHKKNDWVNGYFKSNVRGQEFVIQEDEMVSQWAKSLLMNEDGLKRNKDGKDKNIIAGIFVVTPDKWGLRGDPYLGEDLRSSLELENLLSEIDEFEIQLIKLFKQKTGKSIFDKGLVFVSEYAHGGISSGQVDIDMWRNTFIPLLIERYRILKKKTGGEAV